MKLFTFTARDAALTHHEIVALTPADAVRAVNERHGPGPFSLSNVTPPRFATEFPDFGELPELVAAALLAGEIEDESFEHDGCPSFCRAGESEESVDEKRTLWVQYEDPAKRLNGPGPRFIVQFPDGHEEGCEDAREALQILEHGDCVTDEERGNGPRHK